MAFNGKLLELKTNGTWVEFPLKYVKAESYKVTPDQRMESSANRAASGVLVRTTYSHKASTIDFTTPTVDNNDVATINGLFSAAYTDSLERKLEARYYNPATDSYKTGTFYVPDIDFDILRVDKSTNTIHYAGIRFALIEY